MARTGSFKTSAFFVEMLVVILFFAFSSAIISKIFITAHKQSEISVNHSRATDIATQVAESIKATSNVEDGLSLIFQSIQKEGGANGGNVYIVKFDSDWNESDNESKFTANISDLTDGNLIIARIEIKDDSGGEVFAVTTSKYIAR